MTTTAIATVSPEARVAKLAELQSKINVRLQQRALELTEEVMKSMPEYCINEWFRIHKWDYANKTYKTSVTIKPENVIYQGTFSDVAAGQQLAAQMYDKGVKAIFTAAGGVGVGAINEAKARAAKGVWIVGVDVDQYADGIYEGSKSIILTSAMKRISVAAYNMVKAELDKSFPGGKTLVLDSKNDGVGIPENNPNLSADVSKQVSDVVAQIKAGTITVAAEKGDLIK